MTFFPLFYKRVIIGFGPGIILNSTENVKGGVCTRELNITLENYVKNFNNGVSELVEPVRNESV